MTDYPPHINLAPVKPCMIRGCRRPLTRTEHQAALLGQLKAPEPRQAVRGSDVCHHHADRFAEALAEFIAGESPEAPGLYVLLEQALIKGSRGLQNSTVDTSGHADVGTMWNPAAAQVLADLRDWIRNLVAIVNGDRPGGPHVLAEPPRPLLQLEVIRRHHARWLALYPTLGIALIRELAVMHRTALDAIDTKPVTRRILPRSCAHVEWDPQFGEYYCGGQLFGIIAGPGDTGSRIVCSINPEHVIDRASWMDHADA